MNPDINIRKLPKQKRSRERYQKIMETAFDLLGEVGYDALTTDLIAERSEISVGSIYQFFPNKESIIYTHAEICFMNLHDYFFGLIQNEVNQRKEFDDSFVTYTLNLFEKSLQEVKGYHLIGSIIYTNAELARLDRESNKRFAESLSKIVILPFFPNVEKTRAYFISVMIVEIVDSVFKKLIQIPTQMEKKGIMFELESLLLIYFSSMK
ncbi:TetR/AcrR family transcriptional regulator [Leptospira sp. 96542]|nr:TetR/AcrR family transcriptional regulator [Leptospira sp. 96542]